MIKNQQKFICVIFPFYQWMSVILIVTCTLLKEILNENEIKSEKNLEIFFHF
ncbi:hypothetical protein B4099_3703 [Heyndrickxia coagulans]|uniref:Uncharacterized protein n=1 Tax=Heyndrickxia coagulans TaxID=1398 RepID=A0A150KH00_HEYCO|nr:hypothetical protein B4099_3703 [Heyndrickxia coagulans]